MATKNYSLPLEAGQDVSIGKTLNGQHSNLNLNENYQSSSNAFFELPKTVSNEKNNVLNSDFVNHDDLQTKTVSHSWKKSTKMLPSNFENDDFGKEDNLKKRNSSISKNSTLSLHVSAYENLTEDLSDLSDKKQDCLKQNDLNKSLKNAKQIFIDSASVIQNPFELPRQQHDNVLEPEMSQFKASQRLLNPHMSSASKMASSEYSLEKTFASLPRTVRGLPLVISGDPAGSKFLYCNGNNVYIREIADPTKVEIYSEHAQLTTVAKYSPSGFYIASGDQSGKLRIWDTTQTTHILKAEYAFIAGAIRDIAWNDDSKRLAIVGEGRDRFGHVFLFDTGTSNGNLSGQSRVMTSIDFKPSRPYRLVSGSEDNTVAIFEGPPFKFKTLFHNHARFVNSVRYNKDGSLFASAGADGKVFLCDGVEGEKKGELIDPSVKGGAAHGGGVFALAWNADGSKIASVSGDKTLKIWSSADQSLLKTVTFGNAIEDQQLAVTWQKDTIVSVGLSGFIFYINPDSGEVTKTIRGHNRPITALALSPDKKYAFTADFEGHITRWLISDGTSERLTPQIHKSQVASLAVTSKGTLVSIGWDDTVAFTAGVFEKVENIQANTVRLSSQPRGLDVSPDGSIAAVVCQREIVIFKNEKQAGSVNIKYEAQCGAYQSDGKYLAVGGSDNKVHVYSIQDVNLTEKQALPHAGCITSVSFSNDGKYLVATDNNRKVIPYKVDDNFSVASEKDWTYHNARVNCGAWSPNGRYVATGGLDTNVIVWDIQHSGESPIEIRGAHSASPINGVAWLDDKRLLTVGQDSNIKIWNVTLS